MLKNEHITYFYTIGGVTISMGLYKENV